MRRYYALLLARVLDRLAPPPHRQQGEHGGTLGLSPMDQNVHGSAGTTPQDILSRSSFELTPTPSRGRGRDRGLRRRELAGPGFVGTTAEEIAISTIGGRSFDHQQQRLPVVVGE